jgi:PadR family transcriptional regulator PadR
MDGREIMALYDQIRKGSTNTLILSLLSEEPMYGYQITQELQQRSEGYFVMKEGLLYPALHQMEQDGLVKSEWRRVEGSRQRKYYSITEEGHRVLSRSVTEWTTFTEKLMEVLERHGYVEPESVPG